MPNKGHEPKLEGNPELEAYFDEKILHHHTSKESQDKILHGEKPNPPIEEKAALRNDYYATVKDFWFLMKDDTGIGQLRADANYRNRTFNSGTDVGLNTKLDGTQMQDGRVTTHLGANSRRLLEREPLHDILRDQDKDQWGGSISAGNKMAQKMYNDKSFPMHAVIGIPKEQLEPLIQKSRIADFKQEIELSTQGVHQRYGYPGPVSRGDGPNNSPWDYGMDKQREREEIVSPPAAAGKHEDFVYKVLDHIPVTPEMDNKKFKEYTGKTMDQYRDEMVQTYADAAKREFSKVEKGAEKVGPLDGVVGRWVPFMDDENRLDVARHFLTAANYANMARTLSVIGQPEKPLASLAQTLGTTEEKLSSLTDKFKSMSREDVTVVNNPSNVVPYKYHPSISHTTALIGTDSLYDLPSISEFNQVAKSTADAMNGKTENNIFMSVRDTINTPPSLEFKRDTSPLNFMK